MPLFALREAHRAWKDQESARSRLLDALCSRWIPSKEDIGSCWVTLLTPFRKELHTSPNTDKLQHCTARGVGKSGRARITLHVYEHRRPRVYHNGGITFGFGTGGRPLSIRKECVRSNPRCWVISESNRFP